MRYFPVLTAIAIVAVIAGCSLWLDTAGHLAPGTLVLKRELVTMSDNSWSRRFLIRVVYHTENARPMMTDLTVNHKEFDNSHIGDTLRVRYLNLHIIPGTRLATRNTGTIIADFFRRNPEPPTRLLKAKAQVVQSRLVDKGWLHPAYFIVQLQYTPEGNRDPVQAIEEIVPIAIAPGMQITIEYNANFPRQAHIEGAQRRSDVVFMIFSRISGISKTARLLCFATASRYFAKFTGSIIS